MLNKEQGTRNNLHLTTDSTFNGFPVLTGGALIVEYLEAIGRLLDLVRAQHNKCFILNLVLRYPAGWNQDDRLMGNHHVKFIESLKGRLKAYEAHMRSSGNFHRTKLKFIRCTEVGTVEGGLHHHFVLFVNGNIFRSLGTSEGHSDHLWTMISSAWASALGIVNTDTSGLVHFGKTYKILFPPSEPSYDGYYKESIKDLFQHCSYLAKHDTKFYGLGLKPFSTSRK